MESNLASATDVDPRGKRKDVTDEIADRLKRQQAAQISQARADLNQQRPVVKRDPVSGYEYYDAPPTPFRRLFGSPMHLSGVYATGPQKERRITGGWGDPRPTNGGKATFHKGMDYPGPYNNHVGEEVYAVADGTVTFVGYQRMRGGGVSVDLPRTDDGFNILDRRGVKIADRKDVDFGGIFVQVAHEGEFQNYSSAYFHLSTVDDFPLDARGRRRVTEGQRVGRIGLSGIRHLDKASPHLHFEIWYGRAKVNPHQIVPNHWPGHIDSTRPGAPPLLTQDAAPNIVQVLRGTGTTLVNGVYRSFAMQNQDLIQVRKTMANHATRNAQVTGFAQSALYAGTTVASIQPPVVSNPTYFDFTTGEWNDGKAV